MFFQRARFGKPHWIREFGNRLIRRRSGWQIARSDAKRWAEERVRFDRSPGDEPGFRAWTKHLPDPAEPCLHIGEEHRAEMARGGVERCRRKWQLSGAALHHLK